MRDSPPAFAYRGDCPFGTGDTVPAVPAGTGETCTAGTGGAYRGDSQSGTPQGCTVQTIPLVRRKLTEEPSPCQES